MPHVWRNGRLARRKRLGCLPALQWHWNPQARGIGVSGRKPSGPVQIGAALGDDLVEKLKAAQAAQRQRIEAEARPGESWQAAADRIRKE
ncbi:replication protein RepA, partial [Salmonella enterica subsp. enterica]|nr:replication protein RepA [Salmonella enterica subsp. enterica serovar Poona]